MNYTLITNAQEAKDASQMLRQSRTIAFDIETQGLDPYTKRPLLWAFKGDEGPVYLAHCSLDADYLSELLRALWGKVIIAHNAKFEYQFKRLHFDIFDELAWYDTQLAEKILTNGIVTAMTDLGTVVKKYTGIELPKELQKSWIDMPVDQFPTEEQLAYAAADVAYLHEVKRFQLRRAKEEGLLRTMRLEMAVMPAFAEMELAGFYLNVERHRETVKKYVKLEAEARAAAEAVLDPLWQQAIVAENLERRKEYLVRQGELDAELEAAGIKRLSKDTPAAARKAIEDARKARDKWKPKAVGPINIGSQQQVLAALRVAGIEPVMDNPDGTTKPSLDKNVLREWQHEELVRIYSAWSKPAKVVSTYCETLLAQVNPVTKRVHSSFNQIINSGRCSSREPNMQNMPPDVRHNFEAEEGNVLVVADAKNQEGRLAAILSKDENLLRLFREGGDWHCETAALAYPDKYKSGADVPKKIIVDGEEVDNPDRAGCKNANFSGIYGGTGHTLYKRGYVPTLAIGEKLMEASYSFAPQVRATALRVADRAVEEGVAETIIGRKRYFRLPRKPRYSEDPKSAYQQWRRVRGGIRRAAMNHPIQGSGADIMKQAMVYLLQRLAPLQFRQVAFVHDELVYEGPVEHAEEAQAAIEQAFLDAAASFTSVLEVPADVHVTKEWKK